MAPSLIQSSDIAFFKNIRLVASDMDGTLTRAGKFTPDLLRALRALSEVGIPVLIVTGRSAGWVNGLVSYLPIVGAIAENGGLFYRDAEKELEILVSLPDLAAHRYKLAQMFDQIRTQFPHIQEATDNRFRITDWTFDVKGLSEADLETIKNLCHSQSWGFTYSTVQCHIKPLQQDKAIGLSKILADYFPDLDPQQVVTVGDSPNDESLFDGDRFPVSVGVANVMHYMDQLQHQPAFVTSTSEVEGFCELAQILVNIHS